MYHVPNAITGGPAGLTDTSREFPGSAIFAHRNTQHTTHHTAPHRTVVLLVWPERLVLFFGGGGGGALGQRKKGPTSRRRLICWNLLRCLCLSAGERGGVIIVLFFFLRPFLSSPGRAKTEAEAGQYRNNYHVVSYRLNIFCTRVFAFFVFFFCPLFPASRDRTEKRSESIEQA